MTDMLKKHGGWLYPLVLTATVTAIGYFYTTSMKAAIVEELKDYVPRNELILREKAHNDWAAEATKRIEGKIDDLKIQVNRLEVRPKPYLDRP